MLGTRRALAGLSAVLLLVTGAATAAQAAPINVPWSPDGARDSEVTFTSNAATYYGSLRSPIGETRGAALLLPGSGPTDRNGNQAGGVTPNTLAYVADALSMRGIATLRFDKTGSGRTGIEGIDPSNPPGFVDQVDAAEVALDLLRNSVAVPAEDVAVIGHSEGTLTALSLQERGADVGSLGLLAPPAIRFLDVLTNQVNANLDAGAAARQITVEQADTTRASLAESVDALRSGRALPEPQDPTLAALGLVPVNARFLTEVDAVDPAKLAAAVPSATHVLLTCSEKDLNISCDQIDGMGAALAGTDLDYARLTTASHLLGELGPLPATGYDIYLPLPLSTEFRGVLDAWSDTAFG